jgi:hypothetical protein
MPNLTYNELFSEMIMQNLTYNMSFSEIGLPTVSCGDTNAAARLLEANSQSLSWNGCDPSFFGPSNLILMFSLSLSGSSLHCGPKYFAGFIIASFVSFYLIQLGSVGSPHFTVWLTMFLLLLVGLQDVIQCYFIQQMRQKQYSALKINNIISEYQTKLLHTLIPPNVLQFVSSGTVMHRGSVASTGSVRRVSLLTSGEIPIATVMFCSVEFDVATTEDFDVLSDYLDGLDKLVEPSGMFKYQHVSTG